jgi:hypothetical protein
MMDYGRGKTHLREDIEIYLKCELSFRLIKKVEVNPHTSEMTHKYNILKYCLKI